MDIFSVKTETKNICVNKHTIAKAINIFYYPCGRGLDPGDSSDRHDGPFLAIKYVTVYCLHIAIALLEEICRLFLELIVNVINENFYNQN